MRIHDIEEKLTNFMFHVGQIFLYLFVSNLILANIGFLIGMPVTPFLLPLSLLSAFILLKIFYGDKPNRIFFAEIAVSIVIILFLVLVATCIYDFSYDGNAYHKLAAGFLKMGWNPLYQIPDGNYTERMIGQVDTEMSLWLECYPKATEIFAASIYTLTGNIESGKIYTILGIITAFLLTPKCVSFSGNGKFNLIKQFAFASVAALNPVAVAQMDTFYVDGFLQIAMYILVLLLLVAHWGKTNIAKSTINSLIISSMTILANVKYTGLFYGAFFCVSYYLYEILKERKRPDYKKYVYKRTCFYAATAISSVFLGGASSYVVNMIRHKNPVYTLIGKGAPDIFSQNSPFLQGSNRIENLFLSLFSRVGSVFGGAYDKNLLKMPFTIDWQSELPMLRYPDIRLSGFGVFFGGMFIIAALAIFIHLKDSKTHKKNQWIFLNLFNCIALMLIIEQSWWARYAPYCWLFFLIGLYLIMKYANKWIASLVIMLSLLNSAFWIAGFPFEYADTVVAKKQFAFLRENHSSIRVDYTVGGGYFPGICYNLIDNNINYKVDLNLDQTDDNSSSIYNGLALYSVEE